MNTQKKIRVPRRSARVALAVAVIVAALAPATVYASHQFTDVPDTNIFHSNIGWMADNNITAGCNPPANDQYCPSDNVTREQMAAFMQRLAEGKVVDAATAVSAENADTVDGFDANELARVAYDIDEQGSPVVVAGLAASETVLTAEITAPGPGFITIAGHTGMLHDADGVGASLCQITVDDLDGSSGADILGGSTVSFSFPAANELRECATNGAFTTQFGGTYTVNLRVGVLLDTVEADRGTLVVEYTPFNGVGTGPLIIALPAIVEMADIADQIAASNPGVKAELAQIKAAIDN